MFRSSLGPSVFMAVWKDSNNAIPPLHHCYWVHTLCRLCTLDLERHAALRVLMQPTEPLQDPINVDDWTRPFLLSYNWSRNRGA